MLKQIREGTEETAPLREEEQTDKPRELKRDRPPNEKEPSGKGVGDSSRVPTGDYGNLRRKLRQVKDKHQRDSGGEPRVPDLGERLFPGLLGAQTQTPILSSNLKMMGGNAEPKEKTVDQQMSSGPPGDQGGTNMPISNGWKRAAASGSIGSQLVMRAAVNLQGSGGGGGFPPAGGMKALISPGGKKKKKKKKKKGKKKKKKARRGTGSGGGSSGGGSSGSSSSSRSSSESSSGSLSSGQSEYLPPLRRKARKKPGSVLKLLLHQVESQLSELQGAETHPSVLLGGTKLLTYFHLLVRGNGVQTSSRDGRELYLIAVLLDLLRGGQLERLADGLAARFLALQTAVADGHWGAARHLEIYTPDQASPGGPAVTLAARRHAKVLEKVKGHDNRHDTSKGGSWNRQWGNWQWPVREEGQGQENQKGKGKKGKGGKAKSNPWQGKGGNSWKGGNTYEARGGENKEKNAEKTQGAEAK